MSKRVIRRRSRPKIIKRMLESSLSETTKTRLMYRSGLTYPNLVKYLNELLENELIREIELSRGKMVYKTTRKGREILNELEKIEKHIGL